MNNEEIKKFISSMMEGFNIVINLDDDAETPDLEDQREKLKFLESILHLTSCEMSRRLLRQDIADITEHPEIYMQEDYLSSDIVKIYSTAVQEYMCSNRPQAYIIVNEFKRNPAKVVYEVITAMKGNENEIFMHLANQGDKSPELSTEEYFRVFQICASEDRGLGLFQYTSLSEQNPSVITLIDQLLAEGYPKFPNFVDEFHSLCKEAKDKVRSKKPE